MSKKEGWDSTSLHDVGFVDGGDLVSPLLGGVIEGELGNAPRLLSGDDLQTFDHACHTLKSKEKSLWILIQPAWLIMWVQENENITLYILYSKCIAICINWSE